VPDEFADIYLPQLSPQRFAMSATVRSGT
jgi:hypothetical protein